MAAWQSSWVEKKIMTNWTFHVEALNLQFSHTTFLSVENNEKSLKIDI